jgi:hypothetical protein
VVTAAIVATVVTVGIAVIHAVTTVPSIRPVEEVVDLLEEGEAVAGDVAVKRHGWMLPAKSATKGAITRNIAGPATPRMMTMVIRKSMLPMVSKQIGIKILVPPITLRVSSTI